MGIGAYRHTVLLQNPGPPAPDGQGGFTVSWTDLTPATWKVEIKPATARDLERVASGTVLSTASHVITGRYRDDVTPETRLIFNGRTFHVNGVANPEERDVTLVLTCTEVVS